MNIADFVERGNPEDMEEPLQAPVGSVAQNKASTRSLLPKNALIIGILLLTSSASFGLGLLAGQGSAATAANAGGLIVGVSPTTAPSSAELSAGVIDASHSTSSIPLGGEVVGANSTHTYYLPWCSGAALISKTDKVWFATEQMAKSAGYTAGANCPGL